MNVFDIIERFPDHESCITHLEKVRWGDDPKCPYCESDHVAPKRVYGKRGRWNCHSCKSSFNALQGTLFQGTKIPLQKWFKAIFLMDNEKKSLSSRQLAQHLEMTQPSAWYMIQRIQKEMNRKGKTLLKGIIEDNKTYVGGRPRQRKGTKKTLITGEIEPNGQLWIAFD